MCIWYSTGIVHQAMLRTKLIASWKVHSFLRIGINLGFILWAGFATVLGIGAFLAPIVVTAILTEFEPQQSPRQYRAWVMVWLALGQIFGFAGLTAWPPVITFSLRSRKFIEFDELRLVLISLFLGNKSEKRGFIAIYVKL